MAHDETVAAVIRERLALMKVIDESAQLSFMASAGFRLELFGIVKRLDDHASTPEATLGALAALHRQVEATAREES